ncbi:MULTISPECIES: fumarylacetoacetate hydrolase family protein [unclassified Brevibacterium]|uniref:fumarylacetoacetate hydrolase family protein n=1 Tax=unclassified Brevibacterium TaxID=2614124 RepID=UPI0010F8CCC7|nr:MULTISPECIES: fumarylacetoacetate hydrolase family protein [unclassified Brevibacterium]MCM1011983.1 fumarylacetoacetate hydrolase family protein [Brevibacterium sp. XM4083]
MSVNIYRTAEGWWADAVSGGRMVGLGLPYDSTRELLDQRSELAHAIAEARATDRGLIDREDLRLLSPVTPPCRVVAQMTNYASHVRDSGMDPATVPLTFFRKASGSIAGPDADIRRPAHVEYLDYEVEIGLVVGRPIPVGATIDPDHWDRWIAGVVTANDVSARDVQLPKTQFYESKSYPTFTPLGPALTLFEPGDAQRFRDLRLSLSVNGETRQDSSAAEMIYPPAQALQSLARFQRLDPGDVVLTGTPGGTALKAPAKIVEILGSLLPPKRRWQAFFSAQAKNPRYLQDGDLIEATIATEDGAIDAGTQRTTVRVDR